MITIGTARFDFNTDNEAFAHNVNGRWENFYQVAFERVADEVLSQYERSDETLIIDKLPVDLGVFEEEDFDTQFPVRLREALHAWFKQLSASPASEDTGTTVRRISSKQSAFELLFFFLLHGYLPSVSVSEYSDISFLLQNVIDHQPDQFREFLERYAHYEFLYKRLVFQFNDEELADIVDKVHPSESKFINLYVRVQIQSYKKEMFQTISVTDYRNAIWMLVLAYLFTESGGRFNRKQLVIRTLRGLSARFNLTFVELTRLITEKIQLLEHTVSSLPELWGILKEIREDIHGDMIRYNTDYLNFSYKEIVFSIRFGKKEETAYLLTPENLAFILSETEPCRKLLLRLHEKEIYRLVEIIIPSESEFIISYAQLLNKHKEQGVFTGKTGSEFRIIKWEFIFAVLYQAPLSAFSRRQFVISVIERLAAHYNLSIKELVLFLFADAEVHSIITSLHILPVLAELKRQLTTTSLHKAAVNVGEIPLDELIAILEIPLTAKQFIFKHTNEEVYHIVHRLIPTQSEFIIAYSHVLDKVSVKGNLEGKSGSGFRELKWEFIFAYILSASKSYFERKYFVHTIIRQIASHYNQNVIELLDYFASGDFISEVSAFDKEIKEIFVELYTQELLPLATDQSRVNTMTDESLKTWIIYLFGKHGTSVAAHKEEYKEKWLVYVLKDRKTILQSLWKEGKLDAALLLSIVNRKPELQKLWIENIGDSRMHHIWRIWSKRYLEMKSKLSGGLSLQTFQEYLSYWMIQLTNNQYTSWSENEINQFLAERIHRSIPVELRTVFKEVYQGKNIKTNQIIDVMAKLEDMEISQKGETIEVNNAGMLLLGPYFQILFARLDYFENKVFKSDEEKVRAIFLLQYMVHGKESEYDEMELRLNKIIVGYNKPLPRTLELTQNEKKTVDSLISSVRMSWEKLKNSSDSALRDAFLEREGAIRRNDDLDRWVVHVGSRAYDMLLDYLPYSIGLQRFAWSGVTMEVKWR